MNNMDYLNKRELSEEDKKLLSEMLCQEHIMLMQDDIQKHGMYKVWTILESLANAKTRIAYRKVFFEAGGKLNDMPGFLIDLI